MYALLGFKKGFSGLGGCTEKATSIEISWISE
jgi:hypothetical protein